MPDGIIGSVGVSVVPDAENFWRRFEEQTRAGATESGRRAGNDWSNGFRAGAGEPTVRVRVNTADAQKQTKGLLATLLPLAPALVPLAAAAGLGAAALGEMGAAGILAFKGIQADMKAANADGVKFSAGLGVLKGDLGQLEHTAAHNVLGAFQQTTAKLHAQLPALNNDIAQSSQVLGSIAGHLVGGVIGGLRNFSPALLEIEHGIDGVSSKFESWVTGSGGANFAQTLITDFQHVEPLIENVATAVGHLIAASNGTGLAIVDELNLFAKVLSAIPVPVLSALITGISSLKIAGTITGYMNDLAGSIRRVDDAEGGAGGAGGGMRGRLGSLAETAGKIAAVWVAASLAVGAADNATKSWATSTNDLQYGTHYILNTFNDLLSLNFKGFWGDITGTGAAAAAAQMRGHILAIDDATKLLAKDANKVGSNVLTLNGNKYGYHASSQVTGNFDPNVVASTNATRVAAQEAKTYQATIRGLMTTLSAFYSQVGHAPLSQATQAYTQQASSIDKADQSLQKFLTSGAKTDYTYRGITVGVNAWDAALAKTNGDVAAAEGIVNGQVDALVKQRGIYSDLTAGSLRLGEATAAAGAKYKLSADQVDLFAGALGITADQVANGSVSQRQFMAAIGGVAHALSNGSTAVNTWVAAVAQFNKAGDTAASRGQLIGAALVAANGDTLTYANTMVQASVANQQLVTDFENLKSGVLNLKTGTIDYHNAAAAPLLGDLQNLQTAAMNAASATYQHGVATHSASAASDAFSVYVNDTRGALINQASQLGITKHQAGLLADQYFGIKNSGDLKKSIELAGGGQVTSLLQGILTDLDILSGKNAVATVTVRTVNVGGGSGHQAGSRTAVSSAAGNLFFAAGAESHIAQIARPGLRVWAEPETQGEAYIPLANDWRRGRAKAITQETAKRLGGVAMFETGGFTGVNYSGTANKYGVAPKSKKKTGSSAKSAAAKKPPAFDSSTLTSFLSQIGITTNAFTQAKNQLISALRASKVSSDRLAVVSRDANRLIADSQHIATETARITKAQGYLSNLKQQSSQESSSVRSAFMGLFNLSGAGVHPQVYRDQPAAPLTAASFLADLTTSANRADTTRGELKSLENAAKGNKGLAALVQQLAENPDSAQAQIDALAKAPKGQLSQIGAQYSRLGSTASGAGGDISSLLFGDKIKTANALLNGFDPKRNPALAHAVASLSTTLFGAGKETARGLAKGLISERRSLVTAMHTLAHEMEATIRHDLGIHSPSRKFHEHGRNVVAGLVNGIMSGLPDARSAAANLGGSIDLAAPDRWGGGHNGPLVQVNPSPGMDEAAVGTAAARRIMMLTRA